MMIGWIADVLHYCIMRHTDIQQGRQPNLALSVDVSHNWQRGSSDLDESRPGLWSLFTARPVKSLFFSSWTCGAWATWWGEISIWSSAHHRPVPRSVPWAGMAISGQCAAGVPLCGGAKQMGHLLRGWRRTGAVLEPVWRCRGTTCLQAPPQLFHVWSLVTNAVSHHLGFPGIQGFPSIQWNFKHILYGSLWPFFSLCISLYDSDLNNHWRKNSQIKLCLCSPILQHLSAHSSP